MKLNTFHRSESSNGISGNKKLDGGHLPASSVARAMPKNEQEKVTLRRDFTAGLNKETLLAKGDDKYVFYAFRLVML